MKAIFWDFDGTLVHRNNESFCALKEALQMHNYIIEDSDIQAALNIAHPWNHWETSYENETGEKWWDRLFSKLSDFYKQHGVIEIDKVNSAYKKRILSFSCYTVFDDAPTILEYCQNLGYRNYIISNNYPELPQAIAKLGLAAFFSGYVISADIGFEKPRPEIFQYAIKMAGDPEICYMVGDNPVADIQGAKEVGMQTILVHPAKGPSQYADYNCESLTEIMKIIQ